MPVTELWLIEDPIQKPAPRWRNWWCGADPDGYVNDRCQTCGKVRTFKGSQAFPACCAVHPSKDIAETRAEQQRAFNIAHYGEENAFYLGAYPE